MRTLSIDQLILLYELIKGKQLSDIAKERFTTVSNISNKIKAIENKCGFVFFQRIPGKPLVPTDKALTLLPCIESMIVHFQSLENSIHTLKPFPLRIPIIPFKPFDASHFVNMLQQDNSFQIVFVPVDYSKIENALLNNYTLTVHLLCFRISWALYVLRKKYPWNIWQFP